jgi:3-mercaptopropionate dioxygenase
VSTRTWRPGAVTWAAAERDLHHVENAGDDLAISIHVYGCDYGRLGSSILEVFEEPVAA